MTQFDSMNAFFEMDGHGVYVWSAYGIFFAMLAVLIGASYWQFSSWRKSQKEALRRAHLQASHQQAKAGQLEE